MNNTSTINIRSLTPYQPDVGSVYTLEDTAVLTGVGRRTIVLYSRAGLVSPITVPEKDGWNFSGATLLTLRRIEQLRTLCGANLSGVKLILRLMDEVEHLRADARN